jgi:hypothetical protein
VTPPVWVTRAYVTIGVLSFALGARGEKGPRVVLLQEPASNATAGEVSARVRGELQAAGYDLLIVPSPPELVPKVAVETAPTSLDSAAVLLVHQPEHSEQEPHLVEIWLSDRALRRTFVQRLELGYPQRGPQWVGVQVVELVRSRLAELSVTAEEPATRQHETPPVLDVAPRAQARARRGGAVFLGAGLGVLRGFDGLGQVWTPLIVLGTSLPESVLGSAPLTIDLALQAGALGGQAELSYLDSKTEIRQSFATFEANARFIKGSFVQPRLSVGNGVYTLESQGQAPAPLASSSQRTWSGLTSLGAGLWLEPFHGGACVLEAKMLAAWSKTIIRMENEVVAEGGAPMGLLALELLAVF